MKEIVFKDRVPTNPGRVILTPVIGRANTYDMVRADSPTEEGTPLDRVAFNSIVHSRLTGRYYEPTEQRSVVSTRTLTVNPIPTSGWVKEGNTKARTGVYVIEASAAASADSVDKAFDGNANTNWYTATPNASHYIQIFCGQMIKVKRMRLQASFSPNNLTLSLIVKGSNNGTTWTDLHTLSYAPSTLTEITLTKTGYYSYYRLVFSSNDSINAYVNEWQFIEYEIESYNTNYIVADGVPSAWTEWQRMMISVPASAAVVGVVSNALNGVPVTTILQPGKRYELRYAGTSFVAKEV